MLKEIEKYIQAQEPERQPHLYKLHEVIESALDDEIEQIMYYNLPTFRVVGYKHPVCVYSVATKHISFVTTDKDILARYKERLKGFKISGTTLQLPYIKPFPEDVIVDIIKERIKIIKGDK